MLRLCAADISAADECDAKRVFVDDQREDTGNAPVDLQLVDVDGDGDLDLVTADRESRGISVLVSRRHYSTTAQQHRR